MSVHHYPGDFRIGVLNEPRARVIDRGMQQVQPKLMVFVLLSGHQKFTLGTQTFELNAGLVPDALLLRIARPCSLRYHHNSGQPLIKLSLAMPLNWLEGVPGGSRGAFAELTGDLAGQRLIPDAPMLATARAIIATDAPLERMALGMQMMERLSTPAMADLVVSTRDPDDMVIARLRRLIEASPTGHHVNAADLARACGIGLRRLERLVKAHEGISLGVLIREERQHAAVQALRTGQSVAQAAALAGYTRAENFTAAIRKRYGCAPTMLRTGHLPATRTKPAADR